MNILQTYHQTYLAISLNDFSLLQLNEYDNIKESQAIIQIENINMKWALFFTYKNNKFYIKNIYNDKYINFTHTFTENILQIKENENNLFIIIQNKKNLCARPKNDNQYFIFKDVLGEWESFIKVQI
ncbi:hypothetical protein QSV37_18300 [Acinetobacter sp. VNK23]|uniref:Uncharacterized protein n=1 Tax=Acinetobacter corruptisaponis TaxID=3045147 RepID=A0ABY8RZT7_9GAMM|nr:MULTISPECIES: hypothetical protein [Acinetobacter]MDM1022222.1 hypothetical protein [Acinetobacter thutiue]WHP04461.1 hypothetical protein QLH32_10305 [Acinetobacter sp. KCTC 92772]